MTASLCRTRPSPLASGPPRTWACGILYALGQINFLSDKPTQTGMRAGKSAHPGLALYLIA